MIRSLYVSQTSAGKVAICKVEEKVAWSNYIKNITCLNWDVKVILTPSFRYLELGGFSESF